MRRLVLAAAVLAGCASAEQALPDTNRDLAVAADEDMTAPPSRIPGGGEDAGVDGGATGCAASEHVVINEVQTGGVGNANDEFIELYNPCTSPLDLSNWTLVYRAAAGTNDVTVAPLANGQRIAARGYLLIAGPAYTGAVAPDQTYNAGRLAAAGGGLALRDAMTREYDSVGWGTATNIFVESAPAPAPGDGQSIARTPNGADSDHNDRDFVIATTPTPKGSN